MDLFSWNVWKQITLGKRIIQKTKLLLLEKVLPLLLKTNHWVCVFDYSTKAYDNPKTDSFIMILQIDLCAARANQNISSSDEQHLIIGRDLQFSCHISDIVILK